MGAKLKEKSQKAKKVAKGKKNLKKKCQKGAKVEGQGQNDAKI